VIDKVLKEDWSFGHRKTRQQKGPGVPGPFFFLFRGGLALRELEALTGAWLTGLLTFAHTTIAGKEAFFLKWSTKSRIHLLEGAS
jgi:hypothetical protein